MREAAGEDGVLAFSICSDSFGFFFLVDDKDGVPTSLKVVDTGEDNCVGVGDDADTFVVFFDCGLAVGFPSFDAGSEKPATGGEEDAV